MFWLFGVLTIKCSKLFEIQFRDLHRIWQGSSRISQVLKGSRSPLASQGLVYKQIAGAEVEFSLLPLAFTMRKPKLYLLVEVYRHVHSGTWKGRKHCPAEQLQHKLCYLTRRGGFNTFISLEGEFCGIYLKRCNSP